MQRRNGTIYFRSETVAMSGSSEGETAAAVDRAADECHHRRRAPGSIREIRSDHAGTDAVGLRDYLVVYGKARVVEGGAPEILRLLAPRFLGPDSGFPPPGAPAGWVLRITPTQIGGSGPWTTD